MQCRHENGWVQSSGWSSNWPLILQFTTARQTTKQPVRRQHGKLLKIRYDTIKGSPYSITERKVPELIPVLCSQPAGDVSHIPGGRLPLLSTRPAVTPATLKKAATNFAAW